MNTGDKVLFRSEVYYVVNFRDDLAGKETFVGLARIIGGKPTIYARLAEVKKLSNKKE